MSYQLFKMPISKTNGFVQGEVKEFIEDIEQSGFKFVGQITHHPVSYSGSAKEYLLFKKVDGTFIGKLKECLQVLMN